MSLAVYFVSYFGAGLGWGRGGGGGAEFVFYFFFFSSFLGGGGGRGGGCNRWQYSISLAVYCASDFGGGWSVCVRRGGGGGRGEERGGD